MKGYMFQNKTGAIVFAALTLFGVATLVGTEEEDGALTSATQQLQQQGAQLRGETDAMAVPDQDPEPVVVEEDEEAATFATDEELVLDPTGIEPVGMEPSPDANISEEVELVESSAEIVVE